MIIYRPSWADGTTQSPFYDGTQRRNAVYKFLGKNWDGDGGARFHTTEY
jgi:hypothetical protein